MKEKVTLSKSSSVQDEEEYRGSCGKGGGGGMEPPGGTVMLIRLVLLDGGGGEWSGETVRSISSGVGRLFLADLRGRDGPDGSSGSAEGGAESSLSDAGTVSRRFFFGGFLSGEGGRICAGVLFLADLLNAYENPTTSNYELLMKVMKWALFTKKNAIHQFLMVSWVVWWWLIKNCSIFFQLRKNWSFLLFNNFKKFFGLRKSLSLWRKFPHDEAVTLMKWSPVHP